MCSVARSIYFCLAFDEVSRTAASVWLFSGDERWVRRDEGALFYENYRRDRLFVSVLPLVRLNGNILSEGYYSSSFEAEEGQLTVDVWWNIVRALRNYH